MCLVHLQAIKASVINRFVLQGAISRIIELNSIHPPHEQHRALHAWQAAGSHPTKHHSLTNSIPARDAQGCEVSLGTGCRHFNCSQSNDSIQFVCTKDPSLASAAFSAVFSGVFSDASV